MNKVRRIETRIGGLKYVVESDDDYLDHVGDNFEPEIVELLQLLSKGSKTILDIGANIGMTALLFSRLGEKVYAFEPNPGTFNFLKNNLEKNNILNVTPLNFGLGNDDKNLSLTFSTTNRAGAFVSNKISANSDHEVETIQIKRLSDTISDLNISNIDFIKIDVEGFEMEVLSGVGDVLLNNKPVVMLELNHWCLNAFQRVSVPDYFDFLRSIFPVLYAIEGNNYLDIYNEDDAYTCLYHHINSFKFMNLVGFFDEKKCINFKNQYSHF